MAFFVFNILFVIDRIVPIPPLGIIGFLIGLDIFNVILASQAHNYEDTGKIKKRRIEGKSTNYMYEA